MLSFVLASAFAVGAEAHGHLTLPASSRQGGSLELGGDCTNGACYWFTNNVEIPGEPTLPQSARTINTNVSGVADVYATSPWRAPGSAPVLGSGCGVAGGSDEIYANGGFAPKGIEQGADGVRQPPVAPTNWSRGAEVEVGWAISANHGGGYQYRLCAADGEVDEACFQRTPLAFSGEVQWVVHSDGKRVEMPLFLVTEGVTPAGAAWARDPIPGCLVCDPFEKCGAPLPPVPGYIKSDWDDQVNCYAYCDGSSASKPGGRCDPDYPEQFPPGAKGYSGFGKSVWDWSVVDKVRVPDDIEPGHYLLSWRWDCEESTQVWQNCADIEVV